MKKRIIIVGDSFSGVVQKHFAEHMTKSLKNNEEFWWQK